MDIKNNSDVTNRAGNTDQVTEKTSSNRRSVLIKSAAFGASALVVPSKWSKPVIDTVVMPVHAQMSPEETTTVVVSDDNATTTAEATTTEGTATTEGTTTTPAPTMTVVSGDTEFNFLV